MDFCNRVLPLLNLLLDALHDFLDTSKIVLLINNALSNLLYSLAIEAVIVFECLHLISVLEGCQAVLRYCEVEHISLMQILLTDNLRNGLKHQQDINRVQAA